MLRQASPDQTFPDHGVLSEEVEHIFPDTRLTGAGLLTPSTAPPTSPAAFPSGADFFWGCSIGVCRCSVGLLCGDAASRANLLTATGLGKRELGDAAHPAPRPTPAGGGSLFQRSPYPHPAPQEPGKQQFFSPCAPQHRGLMKHPFPCKIRMLGSAAYNVPDCSWRLDPGRC